MGSEQNNTQNQGLLCKFGGDDGATWAVGLGRSDGCELGAT
jgi:hypothetical protein